MTHETVGLASDFSPADDIKSQSICRAKKTNIWKTTGFKKISLFSVREKDGKIEKSV